MTWTEKLTPKNTEEIKPNLFIQKTNKGYRQIYPAAWNGKINYNNLIFGKGFWKSLLWVFILLLLAYGYYTSTKACEDFQQDPCKYLPNITTYCIGLEENPNMLWEREDDGKTNTLDIPDNFQQVR
jgi:hypothetical protein